MKSFRELLSEETQVILEDEELSGYYLYFIIFRSPQNANKWNLYVGIKHSDQQNPNKLNPQIQKLKKGINDKGRTTNTMRVD